MAKTNLQVRIASETDAQLARLAPKSKSEYVRLAIEEKVRRDTFRGLEEKWIGALKKDPENSRNAEKWLKAESWGPK